MVLSKVTQLVGDRPGMKSQVSFRTRLLTHPARLFQWTVKFNDFNSGTKKEIPANVFTNKFLGPSTMTSNLVGHGWFYEPQLLRSS